MIIPGLRKLGQMNRDRIIAILIVVGILVIVASIGVIGFTDVTSAVNISSIIGNPGVWAGEQVTLEGVTGLSTQHMFMLWDWSYESNIPVKWEGEFAVGEDAEIAVTGEIVIEELLGKVRVYLVASEMQYLN
jgi:hypothetical protein